MNSHHPRLSVGSILLGFVLLAIIGWPMLATMVSSIRESEGLGGGLIDSRSIGEGDRLRPLRPAFETIRLVLACEVLALGVGIPLAGVLVRTNLHGRRIMLWAVSVAAFVPLPLHTTAWLGGFGSAGRVQMLGGSPLLVGWSGAAVIHALAALPWVVLIVGIGLASVDRDLEESAILEDHPLGVFRKITLRGSLGAIAAAALHVAIPISSDMTVTDLLGVRTYAEEAYVQYQIGKGPQAFLTVGGPPLLTLGILLCFAARSVHRLEPNRLRGFSRSPATFKLGRWNLVAMIVCMFVLLFVVGVPLLSLIWRAGRVGGIAISVQGLKWTAAGFVGTMQQALREAGRPIFQGVVWAAFGAVGSVALAWGAAWASCRSRAWGVISAVSISVALAIPGPVAGMALMLAYRDIDFIYDTPVNLIFGYMLRTFPYAFFVLWPRIRLIPRDYLDTARLDGLSGFAVVTGVVLPLLSGPTLAAWAVAFVLSLGELPTTIIVAAPGVQTITSTIWSLLHTGVESHLAGVGLVLISVYVFVSLIVVFTLKFAYAKQPY